MFTKKDYSKVRFTLSEDDEKFAEKLHDINTWCVGRLHIEYEHELKRFYIYGKVIYTQLDVISKEMWKENISMEIIG